MLALDLIDVMNQLQAQVRDMFKDQYKLFKDLYGLKLNYTIIKNPDVPGTFFCAKRVTKSSWNTIDVIPPSPYKKQDTRDITNSTIGLNSSLNQTNIQNQTVNENDHSFLEEDMLNKSFLTVGANTTSHHNDL